MTTLKEAKRIYEEWLIFKNYSKRTIEGNTQQLEIYLKWLKNKKKRVVTTITEEELKGYFKERYYYINSRGSQNAIRTRNGEITVVKQLYEVLVDREILKENPATGIETIRKPRLVLPKDVLSGGEIRRLLRQPDTKTKKGYRDRMILELFIATGMRREELCNLNVSNINLNDRTVMIEKGKNERDRVVPITKIAAKYIRSYINHIRPKLLKENQSKIVPEELIVSVRGRRIRGINLREVLKGYFKSAKLPKEKKVNIHSLRHTVATHLIQSGMPVRHVQELLGHENLDSTMW